MDARAHTLTIAASGGTAGNEAAVLATETDRLKAFTVARRHTRLVKGLRVAFPTLAILLLGAYGVVLGGQLVLDNSGVRYERQEVTERDLKMINPSYRGQTKDGGQFEVRAREAVVDLAMTGPIKLDNVEADLVDAKGVGTKVRGQKGVVDRAKSTVDLSDGVTVDATNGMSARMQRAHVNTKQNRVVGHDSVVTSFPSGTVRADAMDFYTKARKGTYTGNVVVDLKPPPPSATAAGDVPKGKSQPLGLQGNSRDPITIRTQQFDIDDSTRKADFLGQVTAVQGDTRLDADTLHLDYEGPPAKPAAGAAPGAAGKKKDELASLIQSTEQTGRLKRLQAHNNVVITTGADRRVTAQTADFDVVADTAVLTGNVLIEQQNSTIRAQRVEAHQKADTALLTGNVLVEQGLNKLSGQRLAIDRKKGTARLDTPGPGGRIQTTFVQNAQPGAAPKARADTKPERANPFGGLKSDPSAPLDVDAETLDVNDGQKVAIFRGNVRAKQGDMALRTSELHAFYTGEGGLLADPNGSARKPTGGADGKPGAQLSRVEARDRVTIDAKDGQTVSGDRATFDVKSNTVLIDGDVTMTQGQNTIQCARARMDLSSSIMRCERDTPPAAVAQTQPPGKTDGTPLPSAVPPAAPGQQMRMVVFPKQLREEQQKRDQGKKDAPKPAGEAPAPGRAAPPRTPRPLAPSPLATP